MLHLTPTFANRKGPPPMQNGDPSVGGIRGPTKRTVNPILPAANVPSTLGITPNYGAARTKIPQ